MPKRYIHNDSGRTTFVGGVMIPPQEGREVDTQFLPPEAPLDPAGADLPAGGDDQAPGAATLAANIAEMLKLPLRALLPMVDELGDQSLAELHAGEVANATPRVTLLNAIGAQQLQRAEARASAAATGGQAGDASTDAGIGTGV